MARRLLAVLAHPDDESFGVGGTLARYAAEGVDVHVAIATDGAAGSVAEGHEGALLELVKVRSAELEAAAAVLGVSLHTLGYRDSGYLGDPANNDPHVFANAPAAEAIGRVVALIRQLRPQVVLTHDRTGGYFHPDHVQCWRIVTPAFEAAADAAQYPEIGPAPYQSQRLFFHAFPKRWVRLFTWLMRLQGQNPRRMGRNQDIDFTTIGVPEKYVHVRVCIRRYWDVKQKASAQHRSQGGGISQMRLLPEWLQRRFMADESFIRAYPPAADGLREQDLFSGVNEAE